MKTLVATLLLLLLSFPIQACAKGPLSVGSRGGRFQVVQISEYRRDKFLIDTQTGDLWTRICSKVENDDCIGPYWNKEIVEGLTMSTKDLVKYIRAINEDTKVQKQE